MVVLLEYFKSALIYMAFISFTYRHCCKLGLPTYVRMIHSHIHLYMHNYLCYCNIVGKFGCINVWQKWMDNNLGIKVWWMNRLAKWLLYAATKLDNFRLANRWRFAKFSPTKCSPYTICLEYYHTNLYHYYYSLRECLHS